MREFRKTRFITPREKIVSGSGIPGASIFGILLFVLTSLGSEGLLLLLSAVGLGVAVGGGVWLRAYMTGATSDDDD